MYNLLITLGVSAVAFGLGALSGQWYWGFAPALLVGLPLYFVLMRRTGAQVEAIMQKAVSQLQTGRMTQAVETIETARPLGKWQFLIEAQIDGQLGTLEYMQRNWKKARPLLEKAWSRNWQAMAMLAILDSRDKQVDAALKRLDKAELLAKKEAIFFAIKAYILLKAQRTADAQRVVAEAIEGVDASKPLKELQKAIANDKMRRFNWGQVFGQGWYQFFPDQYPQQQAQGRGGAMPQPRHRKTFPGPRGGGRPR